MKLVHPFKKWSSSPECARRTISECEASITSTPFSLTMISPTSRPQLSAGVPGVQCPETSACKMGHKERDVC